MLGFLPYPVTLVLTACLMLLNLVFWFFSLFLPLAIIKLLMPSTQGRIVVGRLLDGVAECWMHGNHLANWLTKRIEWDVQGVDQLPRRDWYFVIANHQSWVDILVLQKVFLGKIPFLKFFLKQELIYVPILGFCWWALDFPFMKRYSREFLAKHPELKGKDVEATKRACAKFKHIPISVMNFLEGTRFTESKYQQQQSPYNGLLKPKAGGLSFVLGAMGEQLHKIVDVTIHYPQGRPTMLQYLGGHVTKVQVHVQLREVTPDLVGSYDDDPEYRQHMQHYVNQLWQDKDSRLQQMSQQP